MHKNFLRLVIRDRNNSVYFILTAGITYHCILKINFALLNPNCEKKLLRYKSSLRHYNLFKTYVKKNFHIMESILSTKDKIF